MAATLPVLHDISSRTFLSYGSERLTRLLTDVGFEDRSAEFVRVFERMLEPWGRWSVGHWPMWPSDVCADNSPIEFSVALDGKRPELRVLIESLSERRTLADMQASARKLTQRLAEEFDVDVSRIKLLEDLFLPETPRGHYAMMHAVCFFKEGPPKFKTYMNPRAQGGARAAMCVREALGRLGYERAWPAVQEYGRRGETYDRLAYFSLDLSSDRDARIKIYFRHFSTTAAQLDEKMCLAASHKAGIVPEFCRTLTNEEDEFLTQPLVSCLSFTDAQGEQPAAATAYVPLWTYCANDAVARDQVHKVLRAAELPTATYDACLASLARRQLYEAAGLHTYIGMRIQNGSPRITSYLSPELYSVNPPPRYTEPASSIRRL